MSILTAVNDMVSAEQEAAERARQRRIEMQRFRRLERVLEDVENHNLARDRVVPPAMWRELQELSDQLPVPAPPRLWQARNTARLHDAILDWESELLDAVAPHRRRFDDNQDD